LAKPTPESRPALLVTELWGLGDVALAIPFLRTAARHGPVTLLAKAHAAPLLRRFAPEVDRVVIDAPWTAFRGKYRVWNWPWGALRSVRAQLAGRHFDRGVSARADPRDHLLLTLCRVRRRVGFARAGSGLLLHSALPPPPTPHRADAWAALAEALGWPQPEPVGAAPGTVRRIVVHTGAAQPVRRWPAERYDALTHRLRVQGYEVDRIDESAGTIDALLDRLAAADAFIGNDSGPGHLAALLGRPTFTIFGPQLPENFAPRHPCAAWIDGAPCPHKPCYDHCRFSRPHCLLDLEVEEVWSRVEGWLKSLR